MKRCASGHYYDSGKYSNCPLCGVDIPNIGSTRPKGGSHPTDIFPATRAKAGSPAPNIEVETVGLFTDKTGTDPVTGWLVCIEGTQKGRDYRLRSEKNFIGRADTMDVCIKGDEAISRLNHAVVSYNPRTNSFKIITGEGRGIVFLNGEEVASVKDLNPYDEIELGKTRLKFFPCCGEYFKWEA
ncbi:FHA domain-containing protein [Candidatus Magnetominusculus dajiuhuensis]|uniref:FHA domain-containing protein n=1 Tax=Candidatus Magnetominusculus dajiuhuensis TaxID=3137712 RepID=UPI003B43869E